MFVEVHQTVQGVEGTELYRVVDGTGSPVAGPRVAIVARIHGNEPVGEVALDALRASARSGLVAGSVLGIVANLDAARVDRRHTVGGVDLNRLWDRDTLGRLAHAEPSTLCSEERRALALLPLLLGSDVVLDLHSTSRPSTPFLLFRDDQRHAALAARLGVEKLITGMHENAIVSGGLCSNVGLSPGERSDRLGFTFEAGQHSAPGNGERAWQVVQRLLHHLGMWKTPPPDADAPGEVYEVLERFLQAPAGAEPYRFVGYVGGPPGSGRRGPPRLLHSFEEIQPDEVVVMRGRHRVVRAQTPFTLLMPAPDAEPGTDLFFVSHPRHGGLAAGVPRDDAEARREAGAIERMLDLIDDDELVRGATWVSFDPRQVLDRCADLIGRTMRLPLGHPHRCLTIVGRGDVGEEEAERRAGQRYRRAMRLAVAEGLPVTRIQLLRGAPLAWLDAITSEAMQSLLRTRAQRQGDDVGGVRLMVSVQQPHTVSLLVAGDLDLALRSGDPRYLRVAVLIEAATVEPDGACPRVRVNRLGMMSARPEIVHAARALVTSLRQEHIYQVSHGTLSQDPRIRDLRLEGGALEARPDRRAMRDLRDALYQVQLGLWADALVHEGLEPVHLESDDALGRWLTATMSATGILDAEALRQLAVVPSARGGWTVDPERAIRRAQEGTVVLARAPVRPQPHQPLLASGLVADDLERWFGWKRWVRGAQSVPGDRGKDIDVALVDASLRDRLVGWYDHARSVAKTAPGRVLVVIAGDGSDPRSEDHELSRAHRALLLEPDLHYLRIQHAPGTHLAWIKGFAATIQQRCGGAGSLALQWESQHGATVSVVAIAVRAGEEARPAQPWSLEGWNVERCAVILSNLPQSGSRGDTIALTTEPAPASNPELLHFGREHCESLLKQTGIRLRVERGDASGDAIETVVVAQLARWIRRARTWRATSSTLPERASDRSVWLARRLGLADLELAAKLCDEMDRATPIETAAAGIWGSVSV